MRRPLITLGIALVVLSPLARPSRWDDFPISSYPMFSRSDIAGNHLLAHALVVHADGRRTPATPAQVGTPEPMVANAIVLHAIERGTAAELCPVVAANVGEADAVAIEVVMSEYDARRYFVEGKREPDARVVHATCPVKR
ncbi:MAG: hypothetical protein U0270_07470 [Labilithrix sp.]